MTRRRVALLNLLVALLGNAGTRTAPGAERQRGEAIAGRALAERLKRFLTQEADAGFNGSVLVAKDGGIVLDQGYGWRDRERTDRVTTTTPYWVASISKQFAAAGILKLMEQGKLSLEDSITRFFTAVPEDKRGITLHQLLTHTAGLEQRYAADGVTDREEAVRAVLAAPLARAPGQGFGYSNDAYTLIAATVEVAAGVPCETFLRQQLLDPAGLIGTGFWGPTDHPEVAAVLGQLSDSRILRPNWGYRGAVGMFSTSEDLYRWQRALEDNRVLSDASRRRMLTPHVARGETGVGYGWFISKTSRGTKSVWTRGYEGFGHGAVLATYPEDGLVIVVTSNSGERDRLPVSHKLAQDLEVLLLAPR